MGIQIPSIVVPTPGSINFTANVRRIEDVNTQHSMLIPTGHLQEKKVAVRTYASRVMPVLEVWIEGCDTGLTYITEIGSHLYISTSPAGFGVSVWTGFAWTVYSESIRIAMQCPNYVAGWWGITVWFEGKE